MLSVISPYPSVQTPCPHSAQTLLPYKDYALDCHHFVALWAFSVPISCSHNSSLHVQEMKVSNGEKSHIRIWTFTVSNGNLLGEGHVRILENAAFCSVVFVTLFSLHFILLYPSNPWLPILHESDTSFCFSLKYSHRNMIILAINSYYVLCLSSVCLFCSQAYSISYYQNYPIFSYNLFLWDFLFLSLFLSN